MNILAAIPAFLVLGVLWLPPFLLVRRQNPRRWYRVALVWALQVPFAAGLIFLADHIGLLNPAGYILGICAAVGTAGALILWVWQSAANKAFKRTGYARRLT